MAAIVQTHIGSLMADLQVDYELITGRKLTPWKYSIFKFEILEKLKNDSLNKTRPALPTMQ